MKHATLDATARDYDDLIPAHERDAFATKLQATRHAIAIGDQLREERALAGMTIREVAALARVGTSTASRLEQGDPDVSIDRLRRVALAIGLRMSIDFSHLTSIVAGGHKKGDVLAVARIAGIMAAKKTAELIPLCHPIALTRVEVELHADEKENAIHCRATAATVGPTGVEMEALTAVQIALLTIYDMCKGVDRGMTITDVGLVSKTGGKSGSWQRE